MRGSGGIHDLWAEMKRERVAAGLPVVGGHPGQGARLLPLTEAAIAHGGDLGQGEVALREAATPADFPNALGNTLYRELVPFYGTMDEPWRQYFRIGENNDFRPKNEVAGTELEDLLPVSTGDDYKDSLMSDVFYTIQLAVYGRLFSITRETVVNDDIGLFRDLPQKMARMVSRTLNKYMVRTILEGNPTCYDGTALFTSGHGNLVSGGSSALSVTSLQAAIYAIQTAVDTTLNPSGTPLGLTPKYLVVPPALEFTARQIVQSSLIVATGTASASATYGNINPLQNAVTIIVDRWLTSTTAWYVFVDPSESPALHAAFLRGHQNPDLLMERPYMSDIMGGGEDPWEVEFDKLVYKCRHQWAGVGAFFTPAYKSAGA